MNLERISYSGDLTLGEARDIYFKTSGIGREYDVPWVKLKTPWFPIFFPNTKGRIKAARLHDLHHIATEYPTTWKGEAEIGAWEIGSGCDRYYWAWILNASAAAIGLVLWPRATLNAFQIGKRCTNLYHLEPGYSDRLLSETVRSLRKRLKLG